MENGKHTKFILTPIIEILKECVNATRGIGTGIETYPLCDYIMQTTFLKMTGAGEQKLKCILWDIATDDFNFRYEFLHNSYGECSSITDKNKVLRVLVDRVLSGIDLRNEIIDGLVVDSATKVFDEINKSVFVSWFPREYLAFQKVKSKTLDDQLLYKKSGSYFLFKTDCNNDFALHEAYDRLFKHRNRCAHNLLSYQENLPALDMLSDEKYEKYDNWFVRFWILLIIDGVFVRLYCKYLSNKDGHN